LSGIATPRERLSPARKLAYGLGDHTVNVSLSAASFFYLIFLTQHAGLRPALAGLVVLVARIVDAISDPAMGRLSDRTRWRAGRRRPYFLIGALPFGFCFALMWSTCPFGSEWGRFFYYAGAYVGVSLSVTCVSVPYLALLPEMATDYDERTSLNTYRNLLTVAGTFVAVGMKSLVDGFGGDPAAWQQAGIWLGIWMVLPWLLVYRVSFEQPGYQRESDLGFVEGMRVLARHRSYRILTGLYILGRVSMDLIGAMFLFWFIYWIGREDDFQPTLAIFLIVAMLALPFWLAVSRRTDKRDIFVLGCAWWAVSMIAIYFAQPDHPRWLIFAAASLAAIGYAVVDLAPWAMLGEVVDEDELITGERREGVYVGCFMFIRKLAGASAVQIAGIALELGGFESGVPPEQQTEAAITTIRLLTAFGPALFLVLAIVVARRYPLTRAAHRRILDQLEERRRA
jgi:sugar (glycoside-pentoside-hexuronide) transporter